MKVLKFELKKIWKQKKLYWIFAIVLLVTSGIFIQNTVKQKNVEERALEQFEPFIEETQHMGEELRIKQLHDGLSELEEKQYEHIKAISTAFFHWKRIVGEGLWEEIPTYENDFLTHVQEFEKHGGFYSPLQGIEREKRIAKNNWMIEHNLSYEDETYPTSPHLFLKETTTILLGVLGIVILLLFFGNFISVEKEQNTWMTLKTQPIPKWKLFLEKYKSILFTMLAFIILVIVMGMIVPIVFGDYTLNLLYPQIVTTGDSFTVISILQYISRAVGMFICASVFVFSLVLFISKSVNNSFIVLMITGFILLTGFMITEFSVGLQSVWNPFQTLRMGSIIETIPQRTDWQYLVITFFWSIILVFFAVYLPDRQIRIFNFSDIKNPFKKGTTHHGKKSWSSILFESRKTKRKGLLQQVFIFTSLLIFIGYMILSQESNQKEMAYIDGLRERVNYLENEFIPLFEDNEEKYREIAKLVDEVNAQLIEESDQRYVAFFKREVTMLKGVISRYEENDWDTLLEYQLYKTKYANGEFDKDLGDGNTVTHSGNYYISYMTLEASLLEKEWLIERNIQPIFSGEFVPTIFDGIGNADRYWDKWEEENVKIDANGLYSLYFYFNKLLYLVPIFILLFLFGGGIADERGKMDTIRFLKTQPIEKKNIFTGKYVYSTLVSIISPLGFILFVVLIGILFDRFGDWYYPILHYDSKSIVETANYTGNRPFRMDVGFHFIPLGEVLLKNISLFLCMLVFILTIAHVFSLWFKNKLTVLASAIIFTVAGYVMSANLLEDKAHLSPFTYFDISRITNGEIATVLDNPAVNMNYGVTVLLLSTCILLVVGYLSLIKKK